VKTFDDGALEEWQALVQLNNLPGSWEIIDDELHAVSHAHLFVYAQPGMTRGKITLLNLMSNRLKSTVSAVSQLPLGLQAPGWCPTILSIGWFSLMASLSLDHG